MKHAARRAAAAVVLLAAGTAQADWHTGRVTQLGTAYDGTTVAFHIEGWSRTNCACYSNWPDAMCLDRTRTSFKEDMAMLLSARARGTAIMANIDENICKVVALYEVD